MTTTETRCPVTDAVVAVLNKVRGGDIDTCDIENIENLIRYAEDFALENDDPILSALVGDLEVAFDRSGAIEDDFAEEMAETK